MSIDPLLFDSILLELVKTIRVSDDLICYQSELINGQNYCTWIDVGSYSEYITKLIKEKKMITENVDLIIKEITFGNYIPTISVITYVYSFLNGTYDIIIGQLVSYEDTDKRNASNKFIDENFVIVENPLKDISWMTLTVENAISSLFYVDNSCKEEMFIFITKDNTNSGFIFEILSRFFVSEFILYFTIKDILHQNIIKTDNKFVYVLRISDVDDLDNFDIINFTKHNEDTVIILVADEDQIEQLEGKLVCRVSYIDMDETKSFKDVSGNELIQFISKCFFKEEEEEEEEETQETEETEEIM